MIRIVKTNLRDTPLEGSRVNRHVVVLAAAPIPVANTSEVSEEVRALAIAALGAEPESESKEYLLQPGDGGLSHESNVREIRPGEGFTVDGVPLRMRDAPLRKECVVMVAVSAELDVPEIFRVRT